MLQRPIVNMRSLHPFSECYYFAVGRRNIKVRRACRSKLLIAESNVVWAS